MVKPDHASHRHPRCVTPAGGSAATDDTKLIADLRRVTEDRDNLLLAVEYITAALDMPDGTELAKILARIGALTATEGP